MFDEKEAVLAVCLCNIFTRASYNFRQPPQSPRFTAAYVPPGSYTMGNGASTASTSSTTLLLSLPPEILGQIITLPHPVARYYGVRGVLDELVLAMQLRFIYKTIWRNSKATSVLDSHCHRGRL